MPAVVYVYLPYKSAISFYNLFAAIGERYFEQQGFQVAPVFEKNTVSCLNRLKADPFGIACVSPLDLFFARSAGEDVKMFYSHFIKNSIALLVRPESPTTALEGLRGQTIGVNDLNSAEAFFVKSLMSEIGLYEGKDYTLTAVGQAVNALDKMNRADIAAYAGFLADNAQISARGVNLRDITPDKYANYLSFGYIGYDAHMTRRSAFYRAFTNALIRGTEFTQKNPEKALKHFQTFNADETRDWRYAQALLDTVLVKSTVSGVKGSMPLIYQGQMDIWRHYADRIGFPIRAKENTENMFTNEYIAFQTAN